MAGELGLGILLYMSLWYCHESSILPLSYFLEFVLRGLVLIMGSPGCIKTVKYVFYVNVRRPDKLVLIKFVVNNLRNCRKQPTKKINHRNINTENCSKFSQNYLLILFWNWKKTIWHYLLFANYFTTIYFFFGNFAISNYFTNSVTFGRLIMEHLDILISGIPCLILRTWHRLDKPTKLYMVASITYGGLVGWSRISFINLKFNLNFPTLSFTLKLHLSIVLLGK